MLLPFLYNSGSLEPRHIGAVFAILRKTCLKCHNYMEPYGGKTNQSHCLQFGRKVWMQLISGLVLVIIMDISRFLSKLYLSAVFQSPQFDTTHKNWKKTKENICCQSKSFVKKGSSWKCWDMSELTPVFYCKPSTCASKSYPSFPSVSNGALTSVCKLTDLFQKIHTTEQL